jgi:DNA-3-methyladenine glycosylase II
LQIPIAAQSRANHIPTRRTHPYLLNDQTDLDAALAALMKADLRLHALVDRAGRPSLPRRPAGFSGLCAIVCAQQLSSASAGAIWGRLAAPFDPFNHDALRRTRPSKLAKLGLSRPKIKTMKTLLASIGKGEIDLQALAEMPADDAHAALMRLHGIGPCGCRGGHRPHHAVERCHEPPDVPGIRDPSI